MPKLKKDKKHNKKAHARSDFNEGNADVAHVFTSFSDVKKPFASWPSLEGLKLISLTDLFIGNTHRGKMVKVKIVSACVPLVGVIFEIEDDFKNRSRLSVYNFPLGKASSYAEIFRLNRVLFVIEPFFKIAMDGSTMIRVDNPSDIVFEDTPVTPQPSETASSVKDEAGKAFARADYESALKLYESAISLNSSDSKFNSICLSNMAACFNALRFYESALEAAMKSMALDPLYLKPKYQAAVALMEMGRLEEAEDIIGKLEHFLKDLEIVSLRQRLTRYKLNRKGQFDWNVIFADHYDKNYEWACDYTSPKLKIISGANSSSNGFFAKEIIQPGELLMVSKSFANSNGVDLFSDYNAGRLVVDYWDEDPELRTEGQFILIDKVQSICSKDKHKLDQFLSITKTEFTSQMENPSNYQGQSYILTREEIKKLIKKNRLDFWETGTLVDNPKCFIGSGIWPKINNFKHSCSPNVTWFCLGSLLIIRASSHISENEELTANKIDQSKWLIDRNIHLKERSIDCNCLRHQIEAKNGLLYSKINRSSLKKLSLLELEELTKELQEKFRKANWLYRFEIFRDIIYVCKLLKNWYLLGKISSEFINSLVESNILDYKCLLFTYSHLFVDLRAHANRQHFKEMGSGTRQLFLNLFDKNEQAFELFDKTNRTFATELKLLNPITEYGLDQRI